MVFAGSIGFIWPPVGQAIGTERQFGVDIGITSVFITVDQRLSASVQR